MEDDGWLRCLKEAIIIPTLLFEVDKMEFKKTKKEHSFNEVFDAALVAEILVKVCSPVNRVISRINIWVFITF